MISDSGFWFLLSGYATIAAFFVVQRLLRRTEVAKSLRGGAFDRGSTLAVGSATGLGLILPLVLDLPGVAVFSPSLVEGTAALALALLGFALRVWSASVLGRFYTSGLTTIEGQKVVATGPYAKVRHPGYLGSILLWTGFGALSGSLVPLLLFPVMFVAVYLYRISAEEQMLVSELGDDYIRYRRKTRKLIPYLY